ncbi:MAG: phosphoenolpyruvate--protein phosphotransferase [Candidatus Omnitrophica bacterium]|nr:phosphoenolpyruvate--protein phosphotransferase [Candidatus Omnitrophota bacterium]
MVKLEGIGVSPGIAMGEMYLLKNAISSIPSYSIEKSQLSGEIDRFKKALIKTENEIREIQGKVKGEFRKEARIFDVHLLILKDKRMIREVIQRLREKRVNIESAFAFVAQKFITAFAQIDAEYLRERKVDIEDVSKRVLHNLLEVQRESLSQLKEKVVVIAHSLSPSETASMSRDKVIAFATNVGGKTSHTAIMARALEIPAVVGLKDVTSRVQSEDLIIIDGSKGFVIINPDEETLESYKRQQEDLLVAKRELLILKNLPCQTKDGRRIKLRSNIELPQEIAHIPFYGAEGIGLYRTEFFYLNRQDLPGEEEQYSSYKTAAEKVNPYPVIIRTLDIGGDKFASSLQAPSELNPFLGWRAIRFCLARPDIFKTQLRAILRASPFGNLKIMYPMISGIEELRKANFILKEAKAELKIEEKDFNNDLEVGAMIETPSAAMTADILAKETDFFSIGTNDLIQYSIAIDRINEKIAYLYEPAHPAILRLIKNIIKAAHKEKIWVEMCGEMAADPSFALLLLGLGIDALSMSPFAIPEMKKIIRGVTFQEAKEFAKNALSFETTKEVTDYARTFYKERKLLNE